jgi:hypothetical protein
VGHGITFILYGSTTMGKETVMARISAEAEHNELCRERFERERQL